MTAPGRGAPPAGIARADVRARVGAELAPAASAGPGSEDSGGGFCANCGAALTGPYCAQCGQKVAPVPSKASGSYLPASLHPTGASVHAQLRRLQAMPPSQRSRVMAGRLSVEHFVFALHVHALVFLVLIPLQLLHSQVVTLLVYAWLAAYLLLAMHVAYGQRWVRTVAKFVVLSACYLVVVMAGIAASTLIALVQV